MSRIFVISDTHFNHKTMIEQGWRPFKDVEQMNETIIRNWNKRVKEEDLVYHMGDVALNQKEKFRREILPQLNGRIIFIKGNHDPLSVSHVSKMFIKFKGKEIELVHDPNHATGCCPLVIHGHIHPSGFRSFSKKPGVSYFNANLELHKYTPMLLNEVLPHIKY